MARTSEAAMRVVLAAAAGGVVGFIGWSIVMQSLGWMGWENATAFWVDFSSAPPGTIASESIGAFGALAAGCAALARDAGGRGRRLTGTALFALLLTLVMNLVIGAFLGAGQTVRPDRISLPDAVTYGAFELAVVYVSLAVGRVVAPLRGTWVAAGYAVCVLATALCGLALGIGIGEGYTWVAGGPCLPTQFCAVAPIHLDVGLRLGALLGAGLGLLQAIGLLAGDLLFHALRARAARSGAPASA